MFNPSREQVRAFFIDSWRKHLNKQVLTPLETMAVDWTQQHPEYHDALLREDALNADYTVEDGQTNPFLHLSMHLAISEQLSIDHPPGIRAAHDALAQKVGPHEAVHEIMECLGEVVWEAQRLGKPFDSNTYLDLIQRRTTRN
ncbi:MAG TPA: DUF1841 domain-containing protein [Pusillimonas sp.]|jgi:hypothetical protein|nr:hypothetical protein [Pusillimonas sp.]MBC43997.1 hypothetical protein [Pusillimonas sp.]HBT32277.1 DUF1841 domain-containing protein [Pusillimonas sp.]HCN72050.1 DUF1841 domain-containing protein [Pusillimonas sp.]HCP78405.1 DUF1841 domain-containing protein [Pusillimonas sp.]|tara:strand:- start:69242 stop:69670 length:429 start_codon:yes stop_codon:yes gene_type:complete